MPTRARVVCRDLTTYEGIHRLDMAESRPVCAKHEAVGWLLAHDVQRVVLAANYCEESEVVLELFVIPGGSVLEITELVPDGKIL